MFHIIVNPVAGRGLSQSKYLPHLIAMFNKLNLKFTSYETTKPKDGYTFAKHICETAADCDGIISIGGDGTVQEIVSGMADAYPHGAKIPIPLGIFPGGTGNDFVMAIEGGKTATRKKYKRNINSVAETFANQIKNRKLRTTDLITANGEAFLVAGNIGIDARIVRDAISLKPKFGGQAYLVAAYKSIMNHKNIPLQVNVNGKTFTKEYTLIAICNASTYGGGLPIAPSAKFDDGKITLCMVNGLSRLKLGILFPSLLFKKHVNLKDINFVDCTELRITLPPGIETLCLDGNLSPKEGEIYFKILPSVLDVFA